MTPPTALRLLGALTLGLLVSGSLTAGASGLERIIVPLDREEDCQETIPEQYATPADALTPVTARILVLLDGIERPAAARAVAFASKAYEPLEVTLRVVRYKNVNFAPSGTDPQGNPEIEGYQYMEDIKAAMGGRRPAGIDVVYTFTTKRMYFIQSGQKVYGLAGLADCIGGIRYPNRSFALGAGAQEGWAVEQAGLTMAHELGHLLGAHHHYANCAEGPAPTLCTVMFNADLTFLGLGTFNSIKFGTLESSVVSGHAQEYLQP